MSTTLIWTTQVTNEVPDNTSGNLPGHALIITITEATSIDQKVFVFQRSPVTQGSTDYEDAFYSVASVNDMADINADNPASGSSFYRALSINLFFSHLDDLSDAQEQIESMLGSLCLANDKALELASATTNCFPADSYERYWGISANASLTDPQILALSHEPGFTRPVSKVYDTDGGAQYLYLIYRASLGAGTITMDGNSVATTLVTRAVVNANGHSASYRIYRTTSTQTGSAITLATT